MVICALSDLVGYIEEHCSCRGEVFFRGQRVDEPLLPSIARLHPKHGGLLETEQALLRQFMRRSLPFLEMRPETQWDWLAVAQHHGLPTRLLDRSVNALAATWFVVERPAESDHGVIWLFHAREGLVSDGGDYVDSSGKGNPFEIKQLSILVPRLVSSRIAAQGGYFTVHPSHDEQSPFRALEEDEHFEQRLVKLKIPAAIFPSIRHDLTRLGVNAMSIYQDLVGLCQDIRWRYAYAADEGPVMWEDGSERSLAGVRKRCRALQSKQGLSSFSAVCS
ncbi:MAG: FRG domain-containing protein [Verrucomicrobia bacterium]|nr:FRG domain-containing protein [Verrucomicrobiota bacterium]